MITLSFSAAQRYLLSPFSYFAHYFLRLRPAELSSALVFGSAFDEAINSLLIDKMEGRKPDIEKSKTLFCSKFLIQEINGETRYTHEDGLIKFTKADLDESILTEEDLESGLNKSWLSLNRKGQLLIEAYAEQVLPRLERVLLVQHQISLVNEEGDKFTGIVDFVAQIDGKIWIIDNKTSSIKYAANSANESAQLATYYEALRDKYDIAGVCFITIPKSLRKKKKPIVEISFIFGSINEELLDKTFQDYDKVLTGIKTGHFHCTRNEENGCCSTPWGCGYKRYCESEGKDMTGLVYHEKK